MAEISETLHERVLLIDDYTPDRYILRRVVERHATTVVEATNAAEGLSVALTMQPFAIFLDLGLPGMSGEELLVELKRRPETSAIPVIIHSSKELSEDDIDSLMENAFAVLSKSLSHPERIRRIAQIFSQLDSRTKAHDHA